MCQTGWGGRRVVPIFCEHSTSCTRFAVEDKERWCVSVERAKSADTVGAWCEANASIQPVVCFGVNIMGKVRLSKIGPIVSTLVHTVETGIFQVCRACTYVVRASKSCELIVTNPIEYIRSFVWFSFFVFRFSFFDFRFSFFVFRFSFYFLLFTSFQFDTVGNFYWSSLIHVLVMPFLRLRYCSINRLCVNGFIELLWLCVIIFGSGHFAGLWIAYMCDVVCSILFVIVRQRCPAV